MKKNIKEINPPSTEKLLFTLLGLLSSIVGKLNFDHGNIHMSCFAYGVSLIFLSTALIFWWKEKKEK